MEKTGVYIRDGQLTLSTELLDLPVAFGEFVIFHELAQILAPNHSTLFLSFVHAYLPDWEIRQQELSGLPDR